MSALDQMKGLLWRVVRIPNQQNTNSLNNHATIIREKNKPTHGVGSFQWAAILVKTDHLSVCWGNGAIRKSRSCMTETNHFQQLVLTSSFLEPSIEWAIHGILCSTEI